MKLIISKKADKQLSRISPFVRRRILKSLRQFKEGEKVDIKKMKGKADEYRIRIGDFRILMKRFQNKDYLVTEIGKRENIYFLTF